MVYTNWDANEPSSQHGCVVANITGKWSDVPCSSTYPYICKISNGTYFTLTLLQVSRHLGLWGWYTLQSIINALDLIFQSFEINAPSSRRYHKVGINLWSYFTLPIFAFTVQPSLTPPPPDGQCDSGWFAYHGKCHYLGLSETLSALDASIYCHDRQSNLVSIHDQGESQFLVQTIVAAMKGTAGSFWTGLHKSLDCAFVYCLLMVTWMPH